ncbi:MAG: transglutaminase-like domain-containing protein [Anaerolineae bacterium]
MEEFLKPTEWCESDHPDIMRKARELTVGLEDDRAKAMALYEFVRSLPYMLGPTRSAVETLKAGEGVCASKANLLVGLLRAAGIPARYHHLYYDSLALLHPGLHARQAGAASGPFPRRGLPGWTVDQD